MKTNKHKIDLEEAQKKIDDRKKAATKLLYAALIGWVIFTSTKIFDLVDMSKPPGAWWLPWVATFFISGGFIIWLLVLEYIAKTDTQRNTCLGMMITAWLAEFCMAAGDTVIRQDQFDIVLPPQIYWIITAAPVFVVLVYSAGAAWFLWKDPDAQMRLKITKANNAILTARNEALEIRARNESESLGGFLADAEFEVLKKGMGIDISEESKN